VKPLLNSWGHSTISKKCFKLPWAKWAQRELPHNDDDTREGRQALERLFGHDAARIAFSSAEAADAVLFPDAISVFAHNAVSDEFS
jgi:hypothetical protein